MVPPFLVWIIEHSWKVCLVSREWKGMDGSEWLHPCLDAPGACLSAAAAVQPTASLARVLHMHCGFSTPCRFQDYTANIRFFRPLYSTLYLMCYNHWWSCSLFWGKYLASGSKRYSPSKSGFTYFEALSVTLRLSAGGEAPLIHCMHRPRVLEVWQTPGLLWSTMEKWP